MEREKLIEETAKALKSIAVLGWIGDRKVEEHAKELVNIKICKIPDGAVVLTREEYERLKALPEKVHDEMDERMKEELAIEKRIGEGKAEQARKETAREILSELKTIVKSEYGTYNEKYSLDWNTGCDMGMGHLLWKIKEIVKEKFGVEVE